MLRKQTGRKITYMHPRRRVNAARAIAVMVAVVLFGAYLFNNHGHAATSLMSRTDLIYGSEIGAWAQNGKPVV